MENRLTEGISLSVLLLSLIDDIIKKLYNYIEANHILSINVA